MKTLRIFLISIITISIISNAQTIIPPGNVSGTWTLGGSPYQIQGDITVPNFSVLTIEPGVIVEFQGHYKLNVQGRLFAIGTENDTIIITINDTTGFHNPEIPDGGWAGIRFINVFSLIDSSSIVYCKLEYGKAIGSWPDNSGGAICVDGFDALTISNCLITNNFAGGTDWPGGGGIALWNSNPEISNNTISNNKAQFGGGIQCYESNPIIKNNVIKYNNADAGGGIVCNENSNPIIINTTIENNNATAGNGGGISMWGSSPSLFNSIISGNSAAFWGGGIGFGGSHLNLVNVTISANTANVAGGILASDCDVQIDSCNFIDNKTLIGDGGSIHVRNCNILINNSSFIDNEAINGSGGAIDYFNDISTSNYELSILNSEFINNQAYITGGGVKIIQYNDSTVTTLLIDKCQFTGNSADYHSGLKIRGSISDLTISNCLFSDNESVRFTAGLSFTRNATGKVYNCIFASNSAAIEGGNYDAGGVSVLTGSNIDFINCTFTDNTASYGAGLSVSSDGIATITNCIFWENSTDQIALDTLFGQGGTLTVNYCDIQGGENSINVTEPSLSTLNWESENIDSDPVFEDPVNNDFRLQEMSPCIGAGIDSINLDGTWYYCPPLCYHGNPRPSPPGSMPDIGACESPFGMPVGIDNSSSQIPDEYSLGQNYPNPFNPTTKIKYQLPKSSFVILKVYDLLGNEIETLVSEEYPTGFYELTWNAEKHPSGVYFYQLRAGAYVQTKKMILLK